MSRMLTLMPDMAPKGPHLPPSLKEGEAPVNSDE
jgi:hypothetical protein